MSTARAMTSAPPCRNSAAPGFQVDLDVLSLERPPEPGAHEIRFRDAQRHQLEDRAVGGGHFRQRLARDQERDVGEAISSLSKKVRTPPSSRVSTP